MTDTWSGDTGGSGSIEDQASGTLSRLIIKVPNYDGGTAVSYLRLGAVPTTEEPGKTLADKVNPASAFIDDDRDRDGAGGETDQGGGHGKTKTQRKAESALLHTKGGWRDHSDGNRITTTTGDKVEVIRGNYKLIVMGRQDDLKDAATSDASGGLLQTADCAPSAISEIKWVRDKYSGTWKVTEEAEKGDQKTVYHGDVEEIYYGNILTTTIGSETPTASVGLLVGNSAASVKANPVITEKTWASTISSSVGSASQKVTSITESVYATDISETTYCDTKKDVTHATVILEGLAAAFIAQGSAAGLKLEAYVGPVIELYSGLKLEFALAAKITISGPVTVGLTWGYNVGLHNMKDELKVASTTLTALMDTKINTAKTEINAATDTKITGVETKIATTKTQLTAAITTKISNVTTSLGTLKTQLATAHVIT